MNNDIKFFFFFFLFGLLESIGPANLGLKVKTKIE